MQFAIHPDAGVAVLGQILEHFTVLALASPHHRREHHKAGLLWKLQHLLDHLLRGRGGYGEAADVAVGSSGAGVEQAEVVVDLRYRGYGRTGVVARRLLVYGDRRGEAVYVVHIRLVHLAEELPGVGREALDVAALAFGVDGVEC